jgi:hypothetical protein
MINTRDCNMTGFGCVENWTEVHGTEVHIRCFAQAQAESSGAKNDGYSGNDYRGQADEQITTSDDNLEPTSRGQSSRLFVARSGGGGSGGGASMLIAIIGFVLVALSGCFSPSSNNHRDTSAPSISGSEQPKALSEAERRQIVANRVRHNQQAGLVNSLLTQGTVKLSGRLMTIDPTPAGSGGFWSFGFEARDSKVRYGFMCSNSNELYFRINRNDVNGAAGMAAMRSHSDKITLYFLSQDWDSVQKCSPGLSCDGSVCPLAIVIST